MLRSSLRSGAAALALSVAFMTGPVLAQGGPGGPTPVTVQVIEKSDFVITTRLPGRVKASTVAEVRPQVSGIIRERLFDEGTEVTEGQELYKIEDEVYVASVNAALAAVSQAEANLTFATSEAERAAQLYANRTGSQQRRDDTAAAKASAEAALQSAQANLMKAEIELDRTMVRAPIGGQVGFSETTTGALVAAQQPVALTTIRALDPVNVDVTQSAADLLQIIRDRLSEDSTANDLPVDNVRLILADGTVYSQTGKLQAAEPQVDPTTGMITLRMSFPNPRKILLPGMYIEVEMPEGIARESAQVPMAAVMRNHQGQPYVWLVTDGRVEQRNVSVARSDGGNWIVTGGLEQGDQLIVAGFQKTAPGAEVIAQTPEEAAAMAGGGQPPAGGAPAPAQDNAAAEPAAQNQGAPSTDPAANAPAAEPASEAALDPIAQPDPAAQAAPTAEPVAGSARPAARPTEGEAN